MVLRRPGGDPPYSYLHSGCCQRCSGGCRCRGGGGWPPLSILDIICSVPRRTSPCADGGVFHPLPSPDPPRTLASTSAHTRAPTPTRCTLTYSRGGLLYCTYIPSDLFNTHPSFPLRNLPAATYSCVDGSSVSHVCGSSISHTCGSFISRVCDSHISQICGPHCRPSFTAHIHSRLSSYLPVIYIRTYLPCMESGSYTLVLHSVVVSSRAAIRTHNPEAAA